MSLPTHGRKYRDISAIYRRNIVYRWVSTRYFMEKYRSGDISGFLARNRLFLAIYRWFGYISRGQRGSTKVRPATVSSTRYSDATVAATVPHLYLLLRGFEPQTKRFGFTRLPPGLSCPLIYKMQQLYIYLNSLYKENIRIFLRAN